jgi:proline iminopeptidase
VKFVELEGARFCYDEAGEDRDGTAIVLHGGRGIGDHRGEFAAFRPLADRYRVFAYDQRGCGLSSLSPPYTFERLADDVEAIRRYFTEQPIVLIGGSFGGMIALTYALRHPRGLTHLILRGTAPSHHHEAEAVATFKARLHKATSASIGMVEKMFSDRVVDDTELRLIWLALQPLYYESFDPDAALERTRTMHLHAETHNALFATKDYDLRDHLHEIAAPTLVICGAKDWICPPSQSKIIADRTPRGELLIVEGANHAVHQEANALVIAAIRDFLARTGPIPATVDTTHKGT